MQMIIDQIWPVIQVVLVDLVLAGDNAIVIALVAAGVPVAARQRVMFIGIAGAAITRVLFALITVQLLQVIGLLLAGGVLLLWVSWKLWRELRSRVLNTDNQNASTIRMYGWFVGWLAGWFSWGGCPGGISRGGNPGGISWEDILI